MSQDRLIPPNPETVTRVLEIVNRFGLQVDFDTVALVIAAHESYLFNSAGGRLEITDKCKMDVTLGESDMEYEVVDSLPKIRARGDQVFHFNAVVINGQFHRPAHVDAYHLEKETCDSCGVQSHCLVKTKDEMGKDVRLCNHCMFNSGVQRLRDESSGYDGCASCSVEKCPNHPNHTLSGEWLKQR